MWDLAEGRANNAEMSFNTKEGMNVYADVSLSYAIEPANVPDFYGQFGFIGSAARAGSDCHIDHGEGAGAQNPVPKVPTPTGVIFD